MLRNDERYLKDLKKDLDKLQKYQYNVTYGLDKLLIDSMKKIIANQQKSRVLLMVAICYMKVKEIKIITYQ